MDETKKWTIYLIFLVTGWATGVGTLGLFPQLWLHYGIFGLLFYLLFTAIFAIVAILESEKVTESGHYFVDLYDRVLKKPAMINAIWLTLALFVSFYAANIILPILGPFVGVGFLGRLISKAIIMALIFLIVTRAKEKTFAIMAIGGIIFISFVVLTTALALTTPHGNTWNYVHWGLNQLISAKPITTRMIVESALRALYGVGLGLGFYLMLGSFMGKRFKARTIIGTGIFIQVILGILMTFAVTYGLAASGYQYHMPSGKTLPVIQAYASGNEETVLDIVGKLPEILKDYPALVALIGISSFFAGFTSILPSAEIGLQITEKRKRIPRNKAALYFLALAFIIGIVDSYPDLAEAILVGTNTITFFTAIFEMYPVLKAGKRPSFVGMTAIVVSVIFLIISGLGAFKIVFTGGIYYVIAGIIAVAIVLYGFLWDVVSNPEVRGS